MSQNTWSKLINSNLPYIYGYAAVADSEVAGIVHVIEHDMLDSLSLMLTCRICTHMQIFEARASLENSIAHDVIWN